MKILFLLYSIMNIVSCTKRERTFCEGFVEGYKSVEPGNIRVPRCPRKPRGRRGSNDFREGIYYGVKSAEDR